MPDLSVDAIGVALARHPNYLPLSAFAADVVPRARSVAESLGIPLPHLMVVAPEDTAETGEPDVSALALAALGPPEADQPLFFVRSGPLRDAKVAALARLVHEAGWAGEDVGITQLDELGGTIVFDLLDWAIDWAVPDGVGATVLICDEPLFADARQGGEFFAAIALRVRRGPGPLRVLGCGEGAPGSAEFGADQRYVGSGPCDGWVALRAALAAGEVADGDRVLLHTKGPLREGWLALHVVDTGGLRR